MYQLDHDPLSELTQELDQLLASPIPRQKAAKQKRQRAINNLKGQIDTLKRFYLLKIGDSVTNGQKLGIITDLTFSTGGMPQVWVIYDNGLSIAETVNILKPEPILKNLKRGDAVIYDHQTHKIKEFQGNGLILTEKGQTLADFTPKYWENNYAQFILFDLKWRYQFDSDRYWIEGINYAINVEIPPDSILKFPNPQAFLEHWLNTQGKNHLQEIKTSNSQEKEQNFIFSLDPDPNNSLSELTDEEQRDRLFLERKVERAFYEAGKALREIRDRRLYRSTHKTFEEYCRERFNMKQSRSYQLMDAAKVIDHLLEQVPPLVEVLPTSERQIRPLTKLEPQQQREVWREAVQAAGGKVPSSRIVKDIVTRIRQKHPIPNPYRVGDVVTILVKENPDLRGKGGCWGIITEIHDFSCTVRLWNGHYTLQIQHLQEMSLSPAQREEMKQISERIFALDHPNLEETAKNVLASLGKINRPFLTSLEEQLLTVLEQSSPK